MTKTMTDTMNAILAAATAQPDRLLVPPSATKGRALKALADELVAAGFAKEIEAQGDAPVWRRDRETKTGYALKLTAAGRKAGAADARSAPEESAASHAKVSRPNASAKPMAAYPEDREETIAGGPSSDAAREAAASAGTFSRAPRAGTKLDQIIVLLSRKGGATIDELTVATGWLPHTTRAALTGLRKRGYELSLARAERAGASVYRLAAAAAEAA